MRQAIRFILLSCMTVSFSTGCSHTPRITYYSLAPTAKPAAATAPSAVANKVKPSVSIASVTLPELVDRLQLVQRINATRMDILEFHRWAEPLKNSISRALADNLSQQLESDQVSVYPQNAGSDAEYQVFVDFNRFEYDGSAVTVDAQWSIRSGASDRLKSGRVQSQMPTGGGSYEGAVAAYGRALTVVSSAVTQALQAEWHASSGQIK